VGYSLGVDLGTTFVAAAVASATRVEMFTLGDRSVVAPAIVYLREDGALVTGEAASLRAVSSPDRVSREFKRRLGNPTPVILGGQPHTVTALLGTLLRDVVHKVIETEGEPPDNVVLTHPANWGPFRRALFEEVPQHAGLANPPMVTEPEAAAAHYAASRLLTDGQTIAVYDLGGGTFDATVLRARPGGVEILGTPEGIERLGGVDFDESILSYVDYTSDGALSELDMRDPQIIVALARLRQDCTLAKEALSVDTETILPVLLPDRHFDVRITRSDFEDMIRAPIESTIGALSRTLHSAQVQPTDLSAVLLVGGSSRIPLIAQMVSAELGRPTVVDIHPKYAVALGAATLAAQAAPIPTPTVPANTVFGTPHQQLPPAADAPASTSPKTPLHDPDVPPPPGAGPTIDWENRRRTTPGDEASNEGGPRRPRLPLATAAALVIAIVATACGLYLLLKPSNVNPGTGTARLTLSKSQVALGETYFATASGFSPRENLRFFWTGQTAGQTNGVMGVFPADSNGSKSHGPIFERDPLGNYTITVTGLTSKRTASAGLQVVQPGS
jgi:actin-like ATPase involved in cell morphogenesis